MSGPGQISGGKRKSEELNPAGSFSPRAPRCRIIWPAIAWRIFFWIRFTTTPTRPPATRYGRDCRSSPWRARDLLPARVPVPVSYWPDGPHGPTRTHRTGGTDGTHRTVWSEWNERLELLGHQRQWHVRDHQQYDDERRSQSRRHVHVSGLHRVRECYKVNTKGRVVFFKGGEEGKTRKRGGRAHATRR